MVVGGSGMPSKVVAVMELVSAGTKVHDPVRAATPIEYVCAASKQFTSERKPKLPSLFEVVVVVVLPLVVTLADDTGKIEKRAVGTSQIMYCENAGPDSGGCHAISMAVELTTCAVILTACSQMQPIVTTTLEK